MNLIGNIVWILVGGWWIALEFLIAGLLLCLTIIGIPFGLQVIKLASLALVPFGKEVVKIDGYQYPSLLLNIIWFPLGAILAISFLIAGLIACLTIIGIPFGLQAFKLAGLGFAPFGKEVREKQRHN